MTRLSRLGILLVTVVIWNLFYLAAEGTFPTVPQTVKATPLIFILWIIVGAVYSWLSKSGASKPEQ